MKYNIRGWLKEINDVSTLGTDLFAFKINYNDPDPNYQGTALYNGNISQTHWKTATNNQNKSYGYTYDNLNRLLNAKYYAANDPANTDRYNENLQYDKNGNITSLSRLGSYNTHKQLIDVLSYEYTGNQLLNVNEASNGHNVAGFKDGNISTTTGLNDYQYDDFGNMILDRNKGITNINYNHLNLPNGLVFNNNLSTIINYTYNAAGAKISKYVNLGANSSAENNTSLTEYLGGYQYNNGVLQFFPHAEGYVKHTINPSTSASEFDYVYNYKDHLGNIRLSYTKDPTNPSQLKTLEENNYYPFGLKHQENLQPRTIRFKQVESTSSFSKYVGFLETIEELPAILLNQTVANSGYQYKYNGKELQDELGLNVYDFGARFYMPDIGRWGQIDPLAEKYESLTPYDYVGGNPITRIDPNGMDWYTDKEGNYHFNSNLTAENQEQFFKDNGLDGAAYKFSSGNISTIRNKGKDNEEITSSFTLNTDGSVTNNKSGHKLDAGTSTDLGETGFTITAFNDRPSTYEHKNGEIISSNDGHDYILHDNKWLKIQTQKEYDKSASRQRSGSRRPHFPRGVNETFKYNNSIVQSAGVKGALGIGGTAGVIEAIVKKTIKKTPIGAASGYVGGQIDAYKAMISRMEQHDKTVDYYRSQKEVQD